ncbi:peptidylprolyl isomerase [Flavobacteriaceae sp. LMIT009]
MTRGIYLALGLMLFTANNSVGQEIIEDKKEEKVVEEKVEQGKRMKLDGVAAVIGDYVVLDSDIDKRIEQSKAAGESLEGRSRCEIFGSLLEEKLYMHQSIQDSLEVNDAEIRSVVDRKVQVFSQQIGDINKLVEFYGKNSEQELRDEMFELEKGNKMIQLMQEAVTGEIEVTPEEVRQFYNSELKEDLPMFGTELRLAQIVVIPKPSEEEEQKVIDRLKSFKADIIDNGSSFTTKAVLYSEDTGSRSKGGAYTLHRKRPQMVKEFRDVAFSLEEGGISEPFKTDFGYHIIYLEKIRGQEYDVRHILLKPQISNQAINEAKEKLENAKKRIESGEISFADAALEVSDEKETKFDGGRFVNPETNDYTFPLTKIDTDLYVQVQNLENNEISGVIQESDLVNPVKFKIITVTDRIEEHEADFAKDYLKIKQLALYDKQLQAIGKWQEETIKDTYVKINGDHRECDFNANWLKKDNN